LWRVNEEDLQELQGTDLVLYMKFTKYLAFLFFGLMCLNLLVLLPTYATGTPAASYQVSDFTKLTVVNVTASARRIWASFALTLVNGLLALYTVYRFWRVSIHLKHKKMIHLSTD
jgi:ABC-type sulfate transport system permease component